MTALYILLAFITGLAVGVLAGIGISSVVVRNQIARNVDQKRDELRGHIEQVDEIIADIKNLKDNGRG